MLRVQPERCYDSDRRVGLVDNSVGRR